MSVELTPDVDHWDCFDTAKQAEAARLAYEAGYCIVHPDGEHPVRIASSRTFHADSRWLNVSSQVSPTHSRHGSCPDAHAEPVCGEVVLGEFDMPMHIASIFIVLVISAIGVYLPTIAGWFVRDTNGAISVGHLDAASFGAEYGFWGNVFFLARHFGTGIIIATAFVVRLYPMLFMGS